MNWFMQLFRRGKIYGDLAEEIEEHLAEKVEALVAGGMSRKEAELTARRRVWECDANRGTGPRSLDVAEDREPSRTTSGLPFAG